MYCLARGSQKGGGEVKAEPLRKRPFFETFFCCCSKSIIIHFFYLQVCCNKFWVIFFVKIRCWLFKKKKSLDDHLALGERTTILADVVMAGWNIIY